MTGFRDLVRGFKKNPSSQNNGEYKDVHNRLMARYPEGMHPSSEKGSLAFDRPLRLGKEVFRD